MSRLRSIVCWVFVLSYSPFFIVGIAASLVIGPAIAWTQLGWDYAVHLTKDIR